MRESPVKLSVLIFIDSKNLINRDNPQETKSLITYPLYRVMNKDQFIHYLLGLVDGEGCFCIAIKKQKSAFVRWVLDPIFHVTQHRNKKEILYNLQRVLGCGTVITKYGQLSTMQFVVQSRKELIDKVIPFFRKNKLLIKRKEFEIFAEVVELLEDHAHKDIKNFRKLLKKVYKMNGEGKYRKHKLEDILNDLGSSETIRQTAIK